MTLQQAPDAVFSFEILAGIFFKKRLGSKWACSTYWTYAGSLAT